MEEWKKGQMKLTFLLPLAFLLILPGCGEPKPEETPPPPAPEAAATPNPAETPPASGPQTLRLGTISGEVPGNWSSEPPAGMGRVAQYALPTAPGDSSAPVFLVFDFGPGEGGSVDANLDRWKKMMKEPGGGTSGAVVEKVSKGGLRITTLAMSGTYLDKPFPMASDATERPGYMMLAAVIEVQKGGEGPYYFRLVGPEKSVTAARPGWDRLIDSLKSG